MDNSTGTTLAWALSWDGARFDLGRVAPVALSFLTKSQWPVLLHPARPEVDQALETGIIREFRIAWVPLINGGESICSERMLIRRLAFRLVWRRAVQGHILTVFRPAR